MLRSLGAVVAALSVVACAVAPRSMNAYPQVANSLAALPGAPAAAPSAEDGEEETTGEEEAAEAEPGGHEAPCPGGMALVEDGGAARFCVDRYEASLVEVLADGTERPYPHYLAVDGHTVRAVSVPGVFPQGYVSELQAEGACVASGKRLCRHDEWKLACKGPALTTFPYGDARRPGVCHDSGKSAVVAVFGAAAVAASSPAPKATAKRSVFQARPGERGRATPAKGPRAKASKGAKRKGSPPRHAAPKAAPARASVRPASVDAGVWSKLNDPALGQVDGALARTGEHGACVNGWGLYDMVGNLHEWVATDPSAPHGTFAGGYYLDTSQNGDGCDYRTVAHAHEYHDYSTGFRCCAEPNR